MTYSTNFSSKALLRNFSLMLLFSMLLSGCSGLLRVSPEARLRATAPTADMPSPQVVDSGPIIWTADLPAVFAEHPLSFELRDEKGNTSQGHQSQQTHWNWTPATTGEYQVRLITISDDGEEIVSRWSRPFRIVPPLSVSQAQAEIEGPLLVGNAVVPWDVSVAGGVGDPIISFELEYPDGHLESVQSGTAARWVWMAQSPGHYRVRAIVTDARGNKAIGSWSDPYLIAPALTIEPPVVNQPSPQMAGTGPFIWSFTSVGGVGKRSIRFELEAPDGSVTRVPPSSTSSWSWIPEDPGDYRLRGIVTDALGNQQTGDWSQPYRIVPELEVAVPGADSEAPQAAQTEPIVWEVTAQGGVAPLSHHFELEQDGHLIGSFATETSVALAWRPEMAGSYRMRARVVDARGNEATGNWSEPYRIAPPLTIAAPQTAIESPQMLETVAIPWSVTASGGVDAISYRFEWERDGKSGRTIATGSETGWIWQPDQSGTYRIRAWMIDALGNEKISSWSVPFVITPRLEILSLGSDRPSPQAAETVPVRWEISVRGGVQPYNYQFELAAGEAAGRFVQQGSDAEWIWRPEQAGDYKVRATVVDARGNRLQSQWTDSYRIVPPLHIGVPQTDRDIAEFALQETVNWTVDSRGGVGKKSVVFELAKRDTEPLTVQHKGSFEWRWTPVEMGFYRVRATLIDARDNRRMGDWSGWTEVRPPLEVINLSASRPSPQAALDEPMQWKVETRGGVGQLNYEFHLRQDDFKSIVQRGVSPVWEWLPKTPGDYQVRVLVRDANGVIAQSDWSENYRIVARISQKNLIAFFPLENLSGDKIPASEIETLYIEKLKASGLRFLGQERLRSFLKRHRVRYTGGISSEIAKALYEEEGVDAVYITSVESYDSEKSPQVALFSRLVLCRDIPIIAWIDMVGLTGDDTPGLLGLKRVNDADELLKRAIDKLVSSAKHYLAKGRSYRDKKGGEIAPKDFYLASDFVRELPYKIAIVPFFNRYSRRNAGFVIPLHLINALHRYQNLEVFDPGVIRAYLLKYRLIMRAGPSLAISDILASETTLAADLVLSGYIFDYQDHVNNPKIDFSTRMVSGPERRILWWSRSYGSGNDGVFFYDFGRIRSANVMMREMSASIGELLFRQ